MIGLPRHALPILLVAACFIAVAGMLVPQAPVGTAQEPSPTSTQAPTATPGPSPTVTATPGPTPTCIPHTEITAAPPTTEAPVTFSPEFTGDPSDLPTPLIVCIWIPEPAGETPAVVPDTGGAPDGGDLQSPIVVALLGAGAAVAAGTYLATRRSD